MKIVINDCYGGYSLSDKAIEMLGPDEGYERDDPKLIEVVESLGDEASDDYAHLIVVEIPDDSTDWTLDNYDGLESVIYVQNGKIHYAP